MLNRTHLRVALHGGRDAATTRRHLVAMHDPRRVLMSSHRRAAVEAEALRVARSSGSYP